MRVFCTRCKQAKEELVETFIGPDRICTTCLAEIQVEAMYSKMPKTEKEAAEGAIEKLKKRIEVLERSINAKKNKYTD